MYLQLCFLMAESVINHCIYCIVIPAKKLDKNYDLFNNKHVSAVLLPLSADDCN